MKKVKYNKRGGIITAPDLYLENICKWPHEDFEEVKAVNLEDVGDALCYDSSDRENCSLVALTNILYPQKNNMDISDVYNIVKEVTGRLGYKPEGKRGLSVLKNHKAITRLLNATGLCGEYKGKWRFLFTTSKGIELLDAGIPFMLSIAYGSYYNHSITVKGYRVYKNVETGKTYTFLYVNDGWTRDDRFLHWKNKCFHNPICLTYMERS